MTKFKLLFTFIGYKYNNANFFLNETKELKVYEIVYFEKEFAIYVD